MSLLFEELSYKIIGLAMDVHNELGQGFLEKVYENSLALLLRKNGLNVHQQHPINVYFHGEIVGEYIADLFVEDKIIIELKSAKNINDVHKAQVINYLKATNTKLGLIINFGAEKLQFDRLINSRIIKINRKISFDTISAQIRED